MRILIFSRALVAADGMVNGAAEAGIAAVTAVAAVVVGVEAAVGATVGSVAARPNRSPRRNLSLT